MFVGHFAVGFAAKRAEPRLPLPLLLAAAQFPDLLWPVFILIGLEHSRVVPGITATSPLDLYDIPYSHSLVTSLLWSVVFGLPWWLRGKRRSALLLAGCVFSHFVLDWVTHRPDLPLAPGSSIRFGLGLWNELGASIAVEAALFALCIWVYLQGTRATTRWGSIGFWVLCGLLLAAWLSAPFTPPPPNIQAMATVILLTNVAVIACAWLIDRGRLPRAPALLAAFVLCMCMLPRPAAAQQTSDQRTAWNRPAAPFHIIGNIHYVGAAGVSSFLIRTPAGSFLLDGGLPETAPLIERGIAQLGFQLRDVKWLLNSHAHFDHAGGLAELKRLSGAKLAVSRGDAPAIRAGSPSQPAVSVDREIADGDRLELGGTVLTAHVTPGHTKGCTTWTMTTQDNGHSYRVVFYCSTSVVDRLLGNGGYPNIVADYERSFPILRALPCDVFLGPHPEFFQMASKFERLAAGDPNPFIDPGELLRYVDASEAKFRKTLAQERAAASQPVPARLQAPPAPSVAAPGD